MTPPPGTAIFKEGPSGSWQIELHTLPAFVSALGEDVVRDFACCFVHADRLVSLTSLFHLSKITYGEASVAFRRNFETMVWFSVGTLRELATSVRALRSSLAKRQMLDPGSPPWIRLRELEDRWENDPFFRDMRNKVAFHVDPHVVEAGIRRPGAAGPVVLVAADNRTEDRSSLRFGIETLVLGTGLTLEAFGRFFEMASQDHGIGPAIQSAFMEAVERAGLKLVHTETGP